MLLTYDNLTDVSAAVNALLPKHSWSRRCDCPRKERHLGRQRVEPRRRLAADGDGGADQLLWYREAVGQRLGDRRELLAQPSYRCRDGL